MPIPADLCFVNIFPKYNFQLSIFNFQLIFFSLTREKNFPNLGESFS